MINDTFCKYPEFNKKHCPDCGEPTIHQCPKCQEDIRGALQGIVADTIPAPKFCEYCGSPFPWTESALSAAKELADGLEALNDDEKEDLKKNIDDIVKDTPRTTVAAQKVKKLLEKAGENAPTVFKMVLVDI